ncbi:Uncharacterized protein SCF082_LOCUS3943 [Durusdinium trenchii]|uniref:Uncharacterized protein n=1 Tax=Durusdinium trenchii TaxID=1381693 RepID=A0ABP0HXT4_9DINO
MRPRAWLLVTACIFLRSVTFTLTGTYSSLGKWYKTRLLRHVSREEFLLSGEGMQKVSSLTAVNTDDMVRNTGIALAGVVFFLYMSYVFWTRIAFGKPFGTAEPVIIPKPEDAFAPKKKRSVGIKDQVSIGLDADSNRGRRVLGLDALIFAYIMFAAAAAMLVFGVVAAYYPIYSGQVAMSSR